LNRGLASAALVAFWTATAAVAQSQPAEDGPTTTGLTLEGVFMPPQRPSVGIEWLLHDPNGPPFDYPPPQLFRPPAAPEESDSGGSEETAEDEWIPLDLQTLPARLPARRLLETSPRSPLLEMIGRRADGDPEGARIEASNESRRLAMRLTLEPADGSGEPIVLLLPPESRDEFGIEPGAWLVVRECWRRDEGRPATREAYPAQNLLPGFRYAAPLAEDDEQKILTRIELSDR